MHFKTMKNRWKRHANNIVCTVSSRAENSREQNDMYHGEFGVGVGSLRKSNGVGVGIGVEVFEIFEILFI